MKYAWYALTSTVSLLSACSPPADPIGRGGAHFQVADPLAADLRAQGFHCDVPGVGGIGAPRAEDENSQPGPPQLPTAGSDVQPANMGSKVSDGQKAGTAGKYKVQCTVRGSSTYTVELDMAGPNSSEFAPNSSGAATIRLSGSINADTGEGTGQVYVRTTETNAVSPNGTCTFQVLTDPKDASQYRIKPGSVDMTFLCPDNTPSNSDFSRCETRGTITLDDCIED